ncbi:MAG: LPS export ABC transporter permease LptF [Deltaproteobacteria bacterium]|nr:LPS export ABC transporter permease LptF [Deltaproteobacteria bacterium]
MPISRSSRYILAEVFTPFMGGFLFFMFVFLMFQLVRLADFFINHGVGLWLLTKLTVYISAAFLPVVLPVSFLVAILVGFGRLSADSEVVAFKASGLSLLKMYLPVGFLSLAVAAAIFYLTNYFIPWGNYQFKRTLVRIGSTKAVANLREGTFTEGFFDLLVYVDKVDAEHNALKGVFIYDERDHRNPNTILARDGQMIPVRTESELSTAMILKLNEGAIHRSSLNRDAYEKMDFAEYRTLLRVEEASSADLTYPKTLSSPNLVKKIEEYRADPAKGLEYEVEYWKRLALSLTPLVFGVLGVGLGIVKNRSVKSYAVFVAFGVVVLYWGLQVVGQTFAEKGWLTPFLALQLSNLAAVPFAILSFKKSSW